MKTKPFRSLLVLSSIVCCALLLGTVPPGNTAWGQVTTYISSVGSEAVSHWKPALTISEAAYGTQSAALDYNPVLESGTFSSTLRAETEFGRFRLYGAFALSDYEPGSNVSLFRHGLISWSNAPAGSNAQVDDFITITSTLPTVDLAIPFIVHGEFDKSGTPMDNGELGLNGDFSFLARIRHTNTAVYLQSQMFRVSDDDYVPGTYWLMFHDVPTNVLLRMRFYSAVSFTVKETYQYTESDAPFAQLTDSDITRTESYRTGPYRLNGTADFSNGILYGWYMASKNGVSLPDTVVSSLTGSMYVQVPYNICPLFDQSKAVNSDASIPVKLQLFDGYGANISSPDLVVTGTQLKRIEDNKVVVLHSAGRSNAGSIFRYDPSLGGYIFTVSTNGLAPGTYQLLFVVGNEPLEYAVHFVVR